MSLLLNGDCLELMKEIEDDSVDLIFCDLPYGQTSCKWDCKIDLTKFWIEVMRIKKLHTPIFFTTTTKFGVDLITSAPKKCYFRYDIVWVKSAPAGFLSAKKMPMRKHEMVYVFYEKLPFYDLSSHKHKFIKEEEKPEPEENYETCDKPERKTMYGNMKIYEPKRRGEPRYDPPLPVSVVKQEPVSVVKNLKDFEGDELCEYDVNKNTYGGGKQGRIKVPKDKKYHETKYNPPLPVSVVKEDCYNVNERHKNGKMKDMRKTTGYNPPLPVSVVKQEPEPEPEQETIYGGAFNGEDNFDKQYQKSGRKNNESVYNPPLPTTMLEIKSTRGKHSTEKPVALMEWILKYYSKEGDVVLDPTMGSGSTGVACKNMNRNFIGIEMDQEIYDSAVTRLE
jgi:DNA modification methylase